DTFVRCNLEGRSHEHDAPVLDGDGFGPRGPVTVGVDVAVLEDDVRADGSLVGTAGTRRQRRARRAADAGTEPGEKDHPAPRCIHASFLVRPTTPDSSVRKSRRWAGPRPVLAARRFFPFWMIEMGPLDQ